MLELVYAYGGANYFDADGQSPFKYALLLCCCHRFGDALTYLWMNNKIYPAVHLMVVCLYYGLILPHFPLLQNPVHPLVNSDFHHYHHMGSSSSSSTTAALTMLGGSESILGLTPSQLVHYFVANQLFLQYYPEYCIDYYLTLASKWADSLHIATTQEELLKIQVYKYEEMMVELLASFLTSLNTDQIHAILGNPTVNQVDQLIQKEYRSRGYLDNYWKSERVYSLINK